MMRGNGEAKKKGRKGQLVALKTYSEESRREKHFTASQADARAV